MLFDFEEESKPFLTLKNGTFISKKKSHFFKVVNPCFCSKNANYLVYLDLVKIRLKIMLGDFAEKKETFFDLQKQNF